jgi:hypothetical protein
MFDESLSNGTGGFGNETGMTKAKSEF